MKTEDLKRLHLFHRTLAEITDKPIFLKLLEIFWHARMTIREKPEKHETLRSRVAEHKLIFEAIKENNVKVRRYFRVHLRRMQKSL